MINRIETFKSVVFKTRFSIIFGLICMMTLLGTFNGFSQGTSADYINGTDKLTVYKDVPGLLPSEFYTISVRSAATNGVWVECYANITRSLWSTIPIAGTGNKEHYYAYVKDWSHTYTNIEMSNGSTVEVKIAAKGGFKIEGSDFTTANVHPAHKASVPTVVNNIVYFTIDNPGQFTVDINGQMDQTNTGNKYAGPAIHTVSLFANPIMVKPSLNDPNVLVVEPGVKPSSNLGSKTILYFKPGVHNIGRNFTIFANKSYYIPGDAVVYGTLTNDNGSGANIKIFGYGTLSGDKIKHSNYDPEYAGNDKSWKLIWSINCSNFVVDGISLMNCPKHTMNLWTSGATKKETFTRWTKIVTWRANGDGIGSCDEITDSFIRTQDDCCYVKGDRKRNVYWTDVNGTVFSMAGMDAATVKPIIIEDCDIIYPRHCSTTWNGGKVFAKRGDQDGNDQNKTTYINVIFRDIRITDPYQTLETFYIASNDAQGISGAYAGITFKNITSVKPPLVTDNRIIGHVNGTWDDITFDNVVLGGKKILKRTDFAEMGSTFVTNVKFLPTNLGIEDLNQKSENEINIYTNLVTKALNVNSNEKIIQKIQLIDSTGKVVFTKSVLGKNENIDLSKFSLGLYIVKVQTSDNAIYNQKIINK